jgi:conjugal transfer pilus assembly protein TraW
MNKKLLLIMSIFMLTPSAFAKDLGVHGRVYEIQENDLLSVLKSRAQAELDSGKWDTRVDEWRTQAKQQVNRPSGISLPRAVETTSHLYDPSIIVPKDIVDNSGQVIQVAGTKANPLNYISMTRQMVFIDGDDREQVDWMLGLTESEPDRFTVILTQGTVIELIKELNRRLFFDQQQIYAKKLSIKSLPALVYQQGLFLRIDEVALP